MHCVVLVPPARGCSENAAGNHGKPTGTGAHPLPPLGTFPPRPRVISGDKGGPWYTQGSPRRMGPGTRPQDGSKCHRLAGSSGQGTGQGDRAGDPPPASFALCLPSLLRSSNRHEPRGCKQGALLLSPPAAPHEAPDKPLRYTEHTALGFWGRFTRVWLSPHRHSALTSPCQEAPFTERTTQLVHAATSVLPRDQHQPQKATDNPITPHPTPHSGPGPVRHPLHPTAPGHMWASHPAPLPATLLGAWFWVLGAALVQFWLWDAVGKGTVRPRACHYPPPMLLHHEFAHFVPKRRMLQPRREGEEAWDEFGGFPDPLSTP